MWQTKGSLRVVWAVMGVLMAALLLCIGLHTRLCLVGAICAASLTHSKDVLVPSLREHYADYFAIGAAVSERRIGVYQDVLQKHFSSLTAENHMKWSELSSAPGRYDFEAADRIVGFAEESGMSIRGHTLVWHRQIPQHVFVDENRQSVSREVLLQRMAEHIQTVVGRYAGRVDAWDVVNEAVSDNVDEFLRETPWLATIGPDYIANAFRMAHQVDSEAKLFYNDYNAVLLPKRDKIIRLIKELQADAVPIHGIGIQGHWNVYGPSLQTIREALQAYAALGLEIHITELDISVYAWDDMSKGYAVPSRRLLRLQARRYQELFRLFQEFDDVITSVTLWGVADDHTWLDDFPVPGRKNWPLLFDEALEPKPAFWSVVGR